jgi:hypothetical protein
MLDGKESVSEPDGKDVTEFDGNEFGTVVFKPDDKGSGTSNSSDFGGTSSGVSSSACNSCTGGKESGVSSSSCDSCAGDKESGTSEPDARSSDVSRSSCDSCADTGMNSMGLVRPTCVDSVNGEGHVVAAEESRGASPA